MGPKRNQHPGHPRAAGYVIKYKGVLPSISPAKLARSLEPFDDKDWLFELKHDGFRSLAYLEDGRCRLVSRHRNVYKSFETLRDALSTLKAKSAILDGEIVCLDSDPFDLVLKS
jgi:bifunctional non-homologous end joining protein LigD